jgi:hypothetical protein
LVISGQLELTEPASYDGPIVIEAMAMWGGIEIRLAARRWCTGATRAFGIDSPTTFPGRVVTFRERAPGSSVVCATFRSRGLRSVNMIHVARV